MCAPPPLLDLRQAVADVRGALHRQLRALPLAAPGAAAAAAAAAA
eukprot:CAMPEP_0115303044 /NCGR_PEP_ID=MMETSP0270-20121206/70706_1 /TAXON_ID=71861 /ORGANISM="Scrippsiella trochoidea, Strain CCMP3099" /LENGTH=44 /DNA_ID= /DNA_START= /DNA_END= /DNA_ORIENTATION=